MGDNALIPLRMFRTRAWPVGIARRADHGVRRCSAASSVLPLYMQIVTGLADAGRLPDAADGGGMMTASISRAR